MADPIDTSALRALLEKATKGEWLYRPHPFDDWGVIRSAETRYFVAQASAGRGLTDEEAASHRAAKTDPYGPNAELIVAMHAALPSLLDEVERLREALKRMHEAFNAKKPIPKHEGDALEAMCRAALGRSTS